MTIDELAQLPERILALERRQQATEQRLDAYIETTDDEVDTETALRITGIRSRDTLTKERDRPGTLLRYCKHGTSVSYSRKSCIDYKLARQLGKHRAPVMWAAAS